jgi:hypothetical protein
LSATFGHARPHTPDLTGAFATGRALATAFVHIETAYAGYDTDQVGRFVEDEKATSAESRFQALHRVEIEGCVDDVTRRNQRGSWRHRE